MRWLFAMTLVACSSESVPSGGDAPGGDPACTGQVHAACHEGNVHRVDECGRVGSMLYECRDVLCVDGECAEPACDDGIRNGRESDVDCAGDCAGCGPGDYCLIESDCASLVCTDNACVGATCDDDVLNGDESDTDCGGETCPPCADWSDCRGNGDCASANCQGGTCLPGTCDDGDHNGNESDTDCGGSCAPCPGGSTCNVDDDCQSRDCDVTCADFQCPAGMVRIGIEPACVDPYEASVWQSSNCSGVQYGLGFTDDYPAGFPDQVESTGCTGTCQGRVVSSPSVDVFACSVAGALPSANLTWFQARRACENAGKVLCGWPSEWLQACWGAPEESFPYGDTYVAARCNDGHAGGTPAAVGALASCQRDGVYDLSGNLWEWTETCVSDDICRSAGGSYAEVGDLLSCTGGHIGRAPDYSGETVGFRCCWRP